MDDYLKRKLKRLLIKRTLALLKVILIKTAWLWGPIAFILIGAFFIYFMIFELSSHAVHDPSLSDEERASAFFFGGKDYDVGLFERYRNVANRWDEGLSDEQLTQVDPYNMTWEWLAQVDRGINDPAFLSLYLENEDSGDFIPQPEKTFELIRPIFTWESKMRAIETETCIFSGEIDTDNNKESGGNMKNDYTKYRIESSIREEPQKLLVLAETMEGVYEHTWEQETIETVIASDECGTLMEEVTGYRLAGIKKKTESWEPLRKFLEELGVTRIQDQEFWIEYWTNFSYMSHGEGEIIDFVPIEGEWLWPAQGQISSNFGIRIDPITGVSSEHHNGVDIAAPEGTPIYTAKSGQIIFADQMGTAGLAVIIQHDDHMESRYYHMSKIDVPKDQYINVGDKIGEIGTTGSSTGNHLHFEIRVSGQPVDPLMYYSEKGLRIVK